MKAVYPFVTDNRNLLSYTEDFTNAYWSNYQLTPTSNVVIAPNGTLTGNKLTENSTNDYHLTQVQLGTLTANATFTASTSLKYIDRRYAFISFYLNQSPFPNIKVTVDLLNKSIVSSIGASASIILQDNDWFRVSVTGVIGNYTTNLWYQVALLDDSLNPSYLGSGKSMYMWGAQLEYGSLSNYQKIATTPQAFMASQFKYNLKDPRDLDAAFRLVFNGGWTHSSTGATPNGTNGYADTKLNLSLNFNTREQSYSLYTQTSNSNANVLAGVTDGSNPTQFYNGTGQYNILSVLYAKGSSFQSGNILMSSNLNSISAFEKTNKLGSTSGTTYSAVNYNYYIGARNNAGTTDFYADRRYSFAHIGNYLTDTEATNFYYCVQKYQTSLGRNVGSPAYALPSVQDTNAKLFLSAINSADATINAAIDTFIQGLKTDGIYSKMKALYPFVGGTASSHKFNLINPQDDDSAFRLVFNGGWTHSANGALPNGTNGYADTKFSPSANLSLNSSHLSLYSRTSIGNLPQSDMGSYSVASTDAFTLAIAFSNVCYMGSYAFGAAINYIDFANTDSKGYYINSRTSSTLLKGFKNNSIGDTSTTSVTGVLPTLNTIIGAENFNSVPTNYSTKQYALASMGSGLTDTEAANLYSRVQTLQSTLNRSV